MTTEEIIRLIFSFLGGGLVAGFLDWLRTQRSDKKARKISVLQAQIQNLYGPLQFFAAQNESYFELNKKFHNAYQAEYIGKDWSQDGATQKNLEKETMQTLDIANAYVDMVTKNNEKILTILKNNYAYIDPDDVMIFRRFVTDHVRLKTEMDKSGRLNTPLKIYELIGNIFFMRPEFIKRAKKKFNAKKKQLDSLMS